MNDKKIMLVEDDEHVLEMLTIYFENEGFHVETAQNGYEALQLFKQINPSLILLDLMLPKLDGIQVCIEVRKTSSVPIIMLTAKAEDMDKILGLELGADDYITKPFNLREVMARVKAVLRRLGDQSTENKVLEFSNLEIDLTKYKVKVQGEVVPLTPKEIEMLWIMASNPDKLFTRVNLLEQVWGYDFAGDDRTVDTHIKRLRQKLNVQPSFGWNVSTIWGKGYKFEVRS